MFIKPMALGALSRPRDPVKYAKTSGRANKGGAAGRKRAAIDSGATRCTARLSASAIIYVISKFNVLSPRDAGATS